MIYEIMKFVITKFFVLVLRLIRWIIDRLSTYVFDWFFENKKECLPSIKEELLLQPAHIIAEKIRKREVKSVDVVKAYIQRIRDVQPIINAVVDDRFAEALEEARWIDEILEDTNKSEQELAEDTPFLGVPVTIKEAIAVKGCLFTVGLAARKGLRATADADVTSLLRNAGAIPIAVTITPELCFWWESYNTLYGRCRNPYDSTRTSGGSSGGEGSILGAAGSVIGVGNDIGGSIRIPANFNGIFGHKPSRGVVSNEGEYPTAAPALQTFLMTGPMCRYASDLTAMLKVLAPNHLTKLKLDEKVDFGKLKIYYMLNDGGNPLISSVDPEITAAQLKVLHHFKTNYNAVVEEVEIEHMRNSFEIWSKVITTSDMKPIPVEMTGRAGKADLFVEFFRWFLQMSDHILPILCSAALNTVLTPKDQKKANKYYEMMHDLEKEFENLLDEQSIFLYPAGPDCALHHGHALLKPLNVSYTAVFNLLGLPVTQCPLGLSSKGLPLGLQVVSRMHNDHLTISVAEELERAFGGWQFPCEIQC